jgi:rhodanese-related sulfurtransferase
MKPKSIILIGIAVFISASHCAIAAAPLPHPPLTRLADAKQPSKNISVPEFEKLRAQKENVVLDVRTEKEFNAGHMPGAVNIDFNSPDFEQKVKKLDPSKTYLVHCAGGVRSGKACKAMEKMNFEKLYNLEGGYKAWEKAGNKGQK